MIREHEDVFMGLLIKLGGGGNDADVVMTDIGWSDSFNLCLVEPQDVASRVKVGSAEFLRVKDDVALSPCQDELIFEDQMDRSIFDPSMVSKGISRFEFARVKGG